jgi:hypothetical protein
VRTGTIVRPCTRCGRPVSGRWWQRWGSPPLCPSEDAQGCSFLASALTGVVAPPAVEPEPDPNPKPEDFWDCLCGSGVVITGRDWETGATNVTTCPRCGGRTTLEAT